MHLKNLQIYRLDVGDLMILFIRLYEFIFFSFCLVGNASIERNMRSYARQVLLMCIRTATLSFERVGAQSHTDTHTQQQ